MAHVVYAVALHTAVRVVNFGKGGRVEGIVVYRSNAIIERLTKGSGLFVVGEQFNVRVNKRRLELDVLLSM